jgi:hypothetical protein
MSKRICGRCKSSVVLPYGQTALFKCQNCSALGSQSEFPEATLFDQLTASPEAMAEKLVYCIDSSSFRVIDSAGRLLAYENEVLASTILPGSFWTKYEEAIAATVAKLKEVEK